MPVSGPKSVDIGSILICVGALVGVAVSIANYLSPGSGIAGTPGAILVIVSTIILLGFGLIMRSSGGSRAYRAFVAASALLDIVGTAFAAYLLESGTLVALMLVCLVGWFAHLFSPRPIPA
ncbi:hypothetical protein C2U70_18005 [Bradyrhizobium guangdongense]|uniref:hypothetical protein n=1 Tax=Bradyrhizobium guangdongense TaxID=1325090 RepID=UPI00112D3BF0|nr:hypothetical protein [Bradyrhizobium guangdongense]TPQ34089.1 hypothetical protein C2U70_18005 [Bradyrhizobium guangdongense]